MRHSPGAWLTACVITVALGVSLQANVLTRRVRPLSDRSTRLLDVAQQVSPTISAMLRRVEQSDLILQVETHLSLDVPIAVTRLITATPEVRYVRLSINPRHSPLRRLELLGHELQHVLEIADAPGVRTQDDMRAHFTRIGRRHAGSDAFETDAAMDVESVVRNEVGQWRSSALAPLLK